MNRIGRLFAYLCAVLNAGIIGFSFLFTKIALEHADPLDTMTYRFAVSVIVMAIPVLFGWIRLNYRDKRGKALYKILLLATMYPLLFFTLQTFGLRYATSAEGGIIHATTPVLTALLAYLILKESTTVFQKIGILMSMIGVVFIFIMKGSGLAGFNMTGMILLFLSCLAFAGYSVLAKSLLKTFTPMEISCLLLVIGSVSFTAFSVIRHIGNGTMHVFIAPLSHSSFLLSILYLGFLSTLITALTANYALSKLDASKLCVFSNLSTVVSIAAGAFILNESIEIYHIVGSVLVIVGVIGTNIKLQSNPCPNPRRISNNSEERA